MSEVKAMQLRLPNDLKIWVKHRAIDNHRSANAEIVFLLNQSRAKENAPEAATSDALVQ